MYKNILLAIIVAIISGCSAPKPDKAPSWYTNVETDYKLYYAVGVSDTVIKAKKNAIVSMRNSLNNELNKLFQNQKYNLKNLDQNTLKKIFNYNEYISKKLSLKNIKIVKSKQFKGSQLALISTPRLELFEKLKIISDAEFLRVKQEYNTTKNFIAIKRYIVLQSLMKNYVKIASLAGYKDFLISTYSSNDEFRFLNEMKDEYDKLRSSINIYILTDANSRIFTSIIKNALEEKGLSTHNSSFGKNSLKLLITSKTEYSKEYTFNKSKYLIKFTTFNKNKKKLAFKQHTFIGKSKKNYKDAKHQAAINLKYRVKKLGIFNLLGIKE